VGPKADLEAVGKRKLFILPRLELRPASYQSQYGLRYAGPDLLDVSDTSLALCLVASDATFGSSACRVLVKQLVRWFCFICISSELFPRALFHCFVAAVTQLIAKHMLLNSATQCFSYGSNSPSPTYDCLQHYITGQRELCSLYFTNCTQGVRHQQRNQRRWVSHSFRVGNDKRNVGAMSLVLRSISALTGRKSWIFNSMF
jgi:hypothetical protein